MIEVVVFDLDDTLYLEANFVRSGFKALDKWVQERLSAPGFFDQAWGFFETGRRGNIFDLTLERLGIAITQNLIDRMLHIYRSHEPNINLEPDAADALVFLRNRSKLALLTDGYKGTQQRKVDALGLQDSLDPIIYTDRWGRTGWKPNPRGFL